SASSRRQDGASGGLFTEAVEEPSFSTSAAVFPPPRRAAPAGLFLRVMASSCHRAAPRWPITRHLPPSRAGLAIRRGRFPRRSAAASLTASRAAGNRRLQGRHALDVALRVGRRL